LMRLNLKMLRPKFQQTKRSPKERITCKAAVSIGLACPGLKKHRCQYLQDFKRLP
jgi:hypothetical protein